MRRYVYYCEELDEIVVDTPIYGQPPWPAKLIREFFSGGFVEFDVENPMIQWKFTYIGEFD